MLPTIRIENFRSIKDVTVNLQDVNLLIGPNNSGKSNLFRAFQFLGDFFQGKVKDDSPSKEDIESLKKNFYLQKMSTNEVPEFPPIAFTITNNEELYRLEIYGYNEDGKLIISQLVGLLDRETNYKTLKKLDINNIIELKSLFYDFALFNSHNLNYQKHIMSNDDYQNLIDKEFFTIYSKTSYKLPYKIKRHSYAPKFIVSKASLSTKTLYENIFNTFSNLKTYSINISTLKNPYPTLEEDYSVEEDAHNLVAFLDNMDDSSPDIIKNINKDLRSCIEEFRSIVFQKVRLPDFHDLRKKFGDKTFKKLGLRDKFKQTYWADELSDGTLYFLALLAIIHQPNTPKLLLIEEPENGIHPRRIKEIIDFLFDLAYSKKIQIVLTTHSTVVIDQFEELPENIFVFDKIEQNTIIKNLQSDIITLDKEQSKELQIPELDLSGSLGDHWASGLIGGVPK